MSKVIVKIAIVGPSGSGKTTAVKYLKKHYFQFKYLQMDQYIHLLYRAKNRGYNLIKKNFGNSFVNEHHVDRKTLAKSVLNDKTELKKLNAIINPLIVNKLEKIYGNYIIEFAIFSNNPLKWKGFFDIIIFIDTSFKNRRRNLLAKINNVGNLSTKNVDNYLHLIKSSKKYTNFIVENNKNLCKFYKKLNKIIFKLAIKKK